MGFAVSDAAGKCYRFEPRDLRPTDVGLQCGEMLQYG